MKILFAIVLSVVLVFEAIECQGFGGIFSGPFFGRSPFGVGFGNGFGNGFGDGGRDGPNGHHRDHHRGRNRYSISAIIKKMEGMEGYFDRFLDRAISAAKARNSSDLEVLQELRNTDGPEFFNHVIQKLNATHQAGNSSSASIILPTPSNASLITNL